MIIKTKLKPPALKSRMLFRKDLIERFCAAKSRPLFLLSGPGGSGKTSLVRQWVKQEGINVAWYALDEEDNDAEIFFRYTLSTLIQADEKLNQTLGPILANQQKIAGENLIPQLIESLCSASQDIYLILDDFHHITNTEIHAALARLLQYLPDRLRLVILSRYCLPVSMDIAALKKEKLYLSAEDLKFTQQETMALFRQVMSLALADDQIHDLNQHFEGWAAGLQLVGLSLKAKGHCTDVSSILSQAHEQVTNYLIHDILSMQSEEVHNVVFATALLERFSPELCAEVTGSENSTGILARLMRMNFFLISLDTAGKWYRYHHMFSEVVRKQVADSKPDLIPIILRKAALWFAKNHYLEDAMRSALRSRNFEFAADLWLKRRKLQLNESFSMLFAMECLTQARLCYAGKQYPDAVHILKIIRNRCVKRNLLELVLQIDILRSANYYALDQHEKAQSLLKKTLVFSESEGYIRPFVNTTKLIAPILVNIAETQPSSLLTSHFKTVLKACDIPFHRATAQRSCKTSDDGDLTAREIEILRWIADGYQNKEIAQKAFISVSTVKTHVHRILVKLGVSTRTQATVKAKELGILKEI